MTAQSSEQVLVGVLTLANKSDATTVTVYLSSQPTPVYKNVVLIKSLTPISSRMAEATPQAYSGSIVLDNSPGSYGFERRFSDLFERYTPINRAITLTIGSGTPGSTIETFTTIFKGKVTGWSINTSAQTLTLTVGGRELSRAVMTKMIDSVSFPYAPAGSLGQFLPIVFGSNVQVKPYLIAESPSGAYPSWAYATILAQTFPVGGIQAYYAKDVDGKYQEIQAAAAKDTAVFSNAGTRYTYVTPETETAYWMRWETTENYIITHVAVEGQGTGNGSLTVDGELKVIIYDGQAGTNEPGRVLAEGAVPGSTYQTSFRGSTGSYFHIYFSLKKPLVMSRTDGGGYWLAVKYTPSSGGNIRIVNTNDQSNAYTFLRHNSYSGGWYSSHSNTATLWRHWFYGMTLADDPNGYVAGGNDSDGLNYATITAGEGLTYSTTSDPRLDGVDLVVEINGLTDDSSGTITGTPDALITRPDHAIRLVNYTWNGSAWAAGNVSTTKYSATWAALTSDNYGRSVGGASSGRQTAADITAAIARNTACRCALNMAATYPVGVYAWGTNITSSVTISDEDAEITQVQQYGLETIINRIKLYYDKQVVSFDVINQAAQGQFRNYAGTVDWYNGLNAFVTYLADASADVFGGNELKEAGFDWLSDSTSAESVAKYFLSVFSFPHVMVTLELPLPKYYALDIFDVITICHPELPAYFGTSPDARNPTYGGNDADLYRGLYAKRAVSYRAQIEAREVVFEAGGFPKLRLTARLLINSNDPT